MSFSFKFPDDIIFKTLGDDIIVTPKDGSPVTIKAPFYDMHDGESILDRIDDDYPHLKDVMNKDIYLFKRGTTVEVDGAHYSYQTKNKNSANTWEVELRNVIKTW